MSSRGLQSECVSHHQEFRVASTWETSPFCSSLSGSATFGTHSSMLCEADRPSRSDSVGVVNSTSNSFPRTIHFPCLVDEGSASNEMEVIDKSYKVLPYASTQLSGAALLPTLAPADG